VPAAINQCFINEADDSLWTTRICDYKETLCIGGEHFALKVQAFKT